MSLTIGRLSSGRNVIPRNLQSREVSPAGGRRDVTKGKSEKFEA